MHKLFTFAIAATTGLTGLATAADFTTTLPYDPGSYVRLVINVPGAGS